VNPFRIDRSVPNTCDQDHAYGDEQFAFHGGLMDRFTGTLPTGVSSAATTKTSAKQHAGLLRRQYGNRSVNYAQHFAMSDNSFSTTFGPSTPGLLNLVAGNTLRPQ